MAMDGDRCRVRLSLRFGTAGQARRAAAALEPDNEGFIKTRLKGRTLSAEAEAGTIPALLHTLDDYLACLVVASRLEASNRLKSEKEL